jgi:long-chain acyl-CoA synthetase
VNKIWLKNYPKDILVEINPDSYQSLPEMFQRSFDQFSHLPAFYSMGVTLSYKQLDMYSRAFAAYLQQVLKLKKGDRIALMMPNILQYPIAVFGALRAGLTIVNVNPLYTAPELAYQLNNSQTETIVVLANFADTVRKALSEAPLKNIIITDIGDLFPFAKAFLVHAYLKFIKKQIPTVHLDPHIKFKQVLAEGAKLTFDPVAITGEDIAFLQYTGGTTGVSKGAMLTHRNLVANIMQCEAWLGPYFTLGKEIIITALPLYHIFSLTANCLFITKQGGLNVLIANPRDIPRMISDMSKFKFSIITAVNTLFNALLKNPEFAKLDFTHLLVCLGGGMAVQRAVAEKWQAVTGKPILEAYGLTETSPAVSINPATLTHYNGTIGLPIPSTDVCILNDTGQEVPIGEPGELAIKGPQVMRGYWKNPAETQKVFTKDGWFLTGDIASLNEQGYIRILERKKDMILVSGFNVFPNEIEDTLVQMPGIVEAAVIGIPDENSGEAVKAFLVKEDLAITAGDVIHFCRSRLTGYKIPKYIEFCKELPKTNVGKILRRALRHESSSKTDS